MNTFSLFVKNDDRSARIADEVKEKLLYGGMVENNETPELVIVVGGDGTFLMAVHAFLDRIDQVSFVGLHTGTLGFMCEYTVEEMDELIQGILNSKPEYREYRMLEIQTDGQKYYALNEMRIESVYKTMLLNITINDVFFETYRGTGICVCTQMGSTGYNRSLRGAVVEYGLPLLELSEISGIHHREFQSLGNSIILNEKSVIELDGTSFDKAVMCYDHLSLQIDGEKKIICRNSDKTVKAVSYRPYQYLKRLKNLF